MWTATTAAEKRPNGRPRWATRERGCATDTGKDRPAHGPQAAWGMGDPRRRRSRSTPAGSNRVGDPAEDHGDRSAGDDLALFRTVPPDARRGFPALVDHAQRAARPHHCGAGCGVPGAAAGPVAPRLPPTGLGGAGPART